MIRSLIRFWAIVAAVLLVVWALLRVYDTTFTNDDGLLGGVDFHVLRDYLLVLVGLLALTTIGTRSRYGGVANASASLLGLLFFWILAELVCFGLVVTKVVDARPFHSRLGLSDRWLIPKQSIWGDISPAFGRWRLPSSAKDVPLCNGDTIWIATNAHGMRDRPRSLRDTTGRSRVVLLGDSFVEGYVVDAPDRFSDRLEAETGNEHLNFGVNGTSVINYYLTYKHLAREFAHDVVVVGILPANDFEDYDSTQWSTLFRYPIYRPYWRGTFPGAELDYSLNTIHQSIAAPENYNNPRQVHATVDSLYYELPLGKKLLVELQLNSYVYNCVVHWASRAAQRNRPPVSSFAEEAFGSRWAPFAHSLAELLKEARGKKVFVVSFPILSDVRAYDASPEDELSPRLEAMCQRAGATYINLLPVFRSVGERKWPDLYVPCDGHFSAQGEALVANTLLAHPGYRAALGLTE